MEFALNHNSERIHATDANKQDEYICPLCRKKVVLRKGEVNIDHFAHQSKCDDTWKYDMSAWHSEWQQQFPKRNQEVVIEFNGEKHRADVMACGYVIEFQRSPITADEFNERNNFYLSYGKKVIWIFDFTDEFEDGRIDYYEEWSSNNDNGGKFKWSYPKRFLSLSGELTALARSSTNTPECSPLCLLIPESCRAVMHLAVSVSFAPAFMSMKNNPCESQGLSQGAGSVIS